MSRKYPYALLVSLGLSFQLLALGNPPARPNVLVVDGQTGATYAMTPCDETGSFSFQGIRPGQYVLKAEIGYSLADSSKPKGYLPDTNLIKSGIDLPKGKSLFSFDQHCFFVDFDLGNNPKITLAPDYKLVQDNKGYIITFSIANIKEISTLKGRLKKTGATQYKRFSESKTVVPYKD